MKWTDIKNVLILLLAAVNVFLICNIVMTDIQADSLPDGVRESAVEVFKRNGIEADKKLIPAKYEKRPEVGVKLYGIDRLAELLLSGRAEYKTSGKLVTAEKDGAVLTLSDGRFEYKTGIKPTAKDGRAVLKALKKLDIDVKHAYYDPSDGFIKNKVSGAVVAGMYLDASLGENGELASLSGVWGELTVSNEKQRVSVIEAAPAICAALPDKTKIDKIKKLYIMEQNGQNYTLKPGWRICSENETYDVS